MKSENAKSRKRLFKSKHHITTNIYINHKHFLKCRKDLKVLESGKTRSSVQVALLTTQFSLWRNAVCISVTTFADMFGFQLQFYCDMFGLTLFFAHLKVTRLCEHLVTCAWGVLYMLREICNRKHCNHVACSGSDSFWMPLPIFSNVLRLDLILTTVKPKAEHKFLYNKVKPRRYTYNC